MSAIGSEVRGKPGNDTRMPRHIRKCRVYGGAADEQSIHARCADASSQERCSLSFEDNDGLYWNLPEMAARVMLEWHHRQEQQPQQQQQHEVEGGGASLCTVCMAQKFDHVLLNCGHCFCEECLKKFRNRECAVCRQRFTKAQRLFY